MHKPDDMSAGPSQGSARRSVRHEGAPVSTASDTTLTMTVNGVQRTIAAHSTLGTLVTHLGHAPESIATALNGEFVPRAQRDSQALRDGDNVTCFQAIVGG